MEAGMARKRLPVHWIFFGWSAPAGECPVVDGAGILHDGRVARGAATVAEVWMQ
jgi:hypothetical protein